MLRIAAACIATVVLAAPAAAAGPYDGSWAVDVIVQRGTCDQGFSFPVRIVDDQVRYDGQLDMRVAGKVGRDGRVQARFSRQNEVLSATGRLAAAGGGGTWQAPSRNCAGRWEARRR